jgi:glycosyltransferase involved in cell wall biosynthesis
MSFQPSAGLSESKSGADRAVDIDGNRYMSVGILTYNSERTIGKCLKAVLSQEYDRDFLDIFLLDAGSKDRTLEIARELSVQVYSEAGCTRGRARNLCIEKAKAEILVMLDSDIIIPKGWLSMVANHFADPDIGEVASPYFTPVPSSSILRRVIYYLTSGWEVHIKGALERENWVSE